MSKVGERVSAPDAISRQDGVRARQQRRQSKQVQVTDPFIRAEHEDDDGYDPYSDRRPEPEPMFQRDPWS
ncbi:hypothetical protein KPC83_01190 [Collinsella sp. zg1085]|uniref:hypothetical protein n=1 Tax=Collinsella sp. zg1085 TaxID=2844380 RepID=UPI001C0DC9C9|nr:hypothetical protein [Collinsella sp. zg1085]QWT17804.1 hypothetical protein KPC83_01190 [Collinsella sp. zg1085]